MCNNLKLPGTPVWRRVNIKQHQQHHRPTTTTAATTAARDTGIFSLISKFSRLTTTLIYLQILIDMFMERELPVAHYQGQRAVSNPTTTT
jgi:hypothetical protein